MNNQGGIGRMPFNQEFKENDNYPRYLAPLAAQGPGFNRFPGGAEFWNNNNNNNNNGPRPNYWPHPHDVRNPTPYDRFVPPRPWINNGPPPRFIEPQSWIRQQQYHPYGNMMGRNFPTQMQAVPLRYFGPRSSSTSIHNDTLAIREPPVEIVYRNSYESLSPRDTIMATPKDVEDSPEPIHPSSPCVVNRFQIDNNTMNRSIFSDLSTSGVSDFSTENDRSKESSSTDISAVSLSPILLLEKVPKLSDICKPDERSFVELFVAASTKNVRTQQGNWNEKASFGVWLNKKSDLNFSGILPEERIQCLKAVLTFGSGKAVELMKEKGHTCLKIQMESDFIINNVSTWIEKFMPDACGGKELSNFSNWDEYKYAKEIKQLCITFQGTVIQWCKAPCKSEGIRAAKKLAQDQLNVSYTSDTNKYFILKHKNSKPF